MKRKNTASGNEASHGTDGKRVGLVAQASKAVLVVLVAGVAFGGLAGTAAADHTGEIHGVEIINVEDRDGDGYASSFQVKVDADAKVKGHEIGKGDPAFRINLKTKRNSEVPVYHDKVAYRDGTFIFEFDASDVFDAETPGGTAVVLLKPVEITGAQVEMYELDNGPGIFSIDLRTDELTTVLRSANQFGIEERAQDSLRDVRVTSNVNGASVYVDGKRRGSTPWTGSFPVDVAERQGKTRIEVREGGYYSRGHSFELSPPGSHRFRLRKVRKPVSVASDPTGATVEIDGKKVGTTPWSGQRWVKSEFDLSVSKQGYETETFEDVTPSASLHARLSNTSASGGSFVPVGSADVGVGNVTLQPKIPKLPSIPPKNLLVANLTPSRPNSLTGQTVTFDASGSYSLGASIKSYSWDFGGGSTATGRVVNHSYSDDGSYKVEVTVTDSTGNRSSANATVTVRNRAPAARLGYSPGAATAVDTVTFDASASSDPDGSVSSYTWGFSDGSTATGQTVRRSFGAGRHTVTLTVEDDDGEKSSTKGRIVVQSAGSRGSGQASSQSGQSGKPNGSSSGAGRTSGQTQVQQSSTAPSEQSSANNAQSPDSTEEVTNSSGSTTTDVTGQSGGDDGPSATQMGAGVGIMAAMGLIAYAVKRRM